MITVSNYSHLSKEWGGGATLFPGYFEKVVPGERHTAQHPEYGSPPPLRNSVPPLKIVFSRLCELCVQSQMMNHVKPHK